LKTDNVQIEKINLENAKLQTAELESTLERDVRSAYVSYTNAIRIRELEKGNIGTAEKNFEYAEALFQQGSINSVQFREAQINLLLAINSYVNSRFNAKLAELELLRLSGNLLKAFEP
jgi:outer membrane protein TolC